MMDGCETFVVVGCFVFVFSEKRISFQNRFHVCKLEGRLDGHQEKWTKCGREGAKEHRCTECLSHVRCWVVHEPH